MDPTTAALLQSLEGQRAHVLGALEGLDAAALHQPVLPTGWTCLGLVQHLAIDVERFWFRAVMAGEDVGEEEEPAWQVGADVAPHVVIDLYRDEIQRANAVVTDPSRGAPRALARHLR